MSVLLVADDFGMSSEVNAAIHAAALAGTLHGASLMVDQAFSDAAVGLAKATPDLCVGLHLNFSDKRDLRVENGWQPFPWKTGFPVTHREARRPEHAQRFCDETRKQFEAFRETKLRLGFVNGHHHMHIQPVIFAEVRRCLAELFPDFYGWIRLGESRFFGLPAWPLNAMATAAMTRDPSWEGPRTTAVWGSFPSFHTRADDVARLLKNPPPGHPEIYVHPGANKPPGATPVLGDDGQDRSVDAAALADPRIKGLARRLPGPFA